MNVYSCGNISGTSPSLREQFSCKKVTRSEVRLPYRMACKIVVKTPSCCRHRCFNYIIVSKIHLSIQLALITRGAYVFHQFDSNKKIASDPTSCNVNKQINVFKNLPGGNCKKSPTKINRIPPKFSFSRI